MMEALFFSETLACTDKSARYQNPEERHQSYRRKNFKFHRVSAVFWPENNC